MVYKQEKTVPDPDVKLLQAHTETGNIPTSQTMLFTARCPRRHIAEMAPNRRKFQN